MIFRDMWVLLFLFPILIFLLRFNKKDRAAGFRFSDQRFLKVDIVSVKLRLRRIIIFVRYVVIILFFLALARPSDILEYSRINKEGIDIVLAIDCSGSMKAEDFIVSRRRKNRFDVAKSVAAEFINNRDGDRIGVVAFAGRAYTVCPLTLDYDRLLSNLERVQIGLIEDGTAIGSAIATSLNRLKDTQAKSKVIILLSDGVNNAGRIEPLAAAEAAKALGVKIYTVGIGTKDLVPFPAKDIWGRDIYQKVRIEIDEASLAQIAAFTGGRYFLASDTESLRQVYREIDKMEKVKVEELGYRSYKDLFHLFLIPALLLLLSEVLISNTLLRKIP